MYMYISLLLFSFLAQQQNMNLQTYQPYMYVKAILFKTS